MSKLTLVTSYLLTTKSHNLSSRQSKLEPSLLPGECFCCFPFFIVVTGHICSESIIVNSFFPLSKIPLHPLRRHLCARSYVCVTVGNVSDCECVGVTYVEHMQWSLRYLVNIFWDRTLRYTLLETGSMLPGGGGDDGDGDGGGGVWMSVCERERLSNPTCQTITRQPGFVCEREGASEWVCMSDSEWVSECVDG